MPGIRLEFAQFGDFDSFDVIRSTSSMSSIPDVDLPSPIATGLTTMYYVDTTVVVGARYYYKIRVWRDGVSAVSNEIQTIALSNVVIYSDFISNFNDITGKVWTKFGDAKIQGGALTLDGSGDYLTTPFSNDYHFENGEDVTIRYKIKLTGYSSGNIAVIFSAYQYTPTHLGYDVRVSTTYTGFVTWTAGTILFPYVVPLNTETEISLERKGMVWRLYVNGTQNGSSITQSTNYTKPIDQVSVLGSGTLSGDGSTRDLKGTLRFFQMIKGKALGDGGTTTPRIVE